MIYSTDRILSTHAGFLPRPGDLREMIGEKAAGRPYDEAALVGRLPSAVAEVVKQQIECGIDVVNDGEYGKSNFTNYVRERIGGFEIREHRGDKEEVLSIIARDSRKFVGYFEANPRPRSRTGMGFPVCVERLHYSELGLVELHQDIANFKTALEETGASYGFLPSQYAGDRRALARQRLLQIQ